MIEYDRLHGMRLLGAGSPLPLGIPRLDLIQAKCVVIVLNFYEIPTKGLYLGHLILKVLAHSIAFASIADM